MTETIKTGPYVAYREPTKLPPLRAALRTLTDLHAHRHPEMHNLFVVNMGATPAAESVGEYCCAWQAVYSHINSPRPWWRCLLRIA